MGGRGGEKAGGTGRGWQVTSDQVEIGRLQAALDQAWYTNQKLQRRCQALESNEAAVVRALGRLKRAIVKAAAGATLLAVSSRDMHAADKWLERTKQPQLEGGGN